MQLIKLPARQTAAASYNILCGFLLLAYGFFPHPRAFKITKKKKESSLFCAH